MHELMGRHLGHVRYLAFMALVIGLCFAGPVGGARPANASGDWPMFRHDAAHLGVATSGGISTSNASALAAGWTASLGTGSDTSPAVAMDSSTGDTVAYVGSAGGILSAFATSNGAELWSYTEPGKASPIDTSPDVYDGVVYFASVSGIVYAVDANSGLLDCSFNTKKHIQSSPTVVAATDGSGPVVFIGTEAHGGEWAIYGVGNSHGACEKDWFFNGFSVAPGGTWSSAAVGTDAQGESLVVFGSKDDDDSVYALDATTGDLVWRYQTSDVKEQDVGASPLISAPSVNGIADGAVYEGGKDCVEYALDLSNGTVLWKFSLAKKAGFCVSSAALSGSTLVVGSDTGVYALNAATGAMLWQQLSGQSIPSSPSISGPTAGQVVLVAGFKGELWALNLSSGAVLWNVTPSSTGYYASPAIVGSTMYDVDLSGIVRTFTTGS